MVQKHRSARKATVAKDVSPMRNMSINKYSLSSSPADTFGFGARLTVPTARFNNSSSASSTANQWQYNNMVNNKREQFNNMHFC